MIGAATLWTPYCGPGPAPAELWARWNLDPLLLAVLAAVGLAWAMTEGRRAGPGRRAAFAAGMGLLVVAFVSPLCALSSALFAARVGHHVLLIAVAAPLFAWAAPAAPAWLRRGLGPAAALHFLLVWLWHAPAPYAWALSADAAYWLMQASLLGSAVALWWAVRDAPAPAAVAALAATMVQMGLLGALITFAAQPLYAPHFATTAAWGLSALEDQQTAGLIMWAPAAGLYLLAALARLGLWLGPDARPAAAP